MFVGTDEHGGSIEVKKSLKERQDPFLGDLCEGRENAGLPFIREVPDSVRGLIRVQYPPRVNEKGYGWWLKAYLRHVRTQRGQLN